MIINRLKKLMEEKKITQSDLVMNTGVSKATISLLVNNKSEPSISVAFAIARLFDMTIEEIFFDEDELEGYEAGVVREVDKMVYINKNIFKVEMAMALPENTTIEEVNNRIESIKSLNATVINIKKI